MGKEVEQQTSIKLAVYCDFATGLKKLKIPPILQGWALTDWSVTSGTGLAMMPECRCRTKHCKLTKNQQCWTELIIGIPASMHVHYPDTCCMTKAVLRVHVLHVQCCPCPCCMSMSMLHAHVNVHVHIYRNAGMPHRLASSQSSTELKKTNDTGTGPVTGLSSHSPAFL
jgi:hypothetical protein